MIVDTPTHIFSRAVLLRLLHQEYCATSGCCILQTSTHPSEIPIRHPFLSCGKNPALLAFALS